MGHCVSSYFNNSSSNIYSLRDSRNMPHCTLELPEDATCFHQCKGKGNGPIHHKYINYILDTMVHFGIDIRDSEMQNLGYFRPESVGASEQQIRWFKEEAAKRNLPTFERGRKIYYYLGA